MRYLLITLLLTSCGSVPVVETQEVNIEYKNYLPNGFSPYMTNGSMLNKGVNLNTQTDILKYGYWRNQVWSLADQSQFRWVGWNYTLGIKVFSFLDVEYEHFSKHILDKTDPFLESYGARFPVEDSINIRIYLYRKDYKYSIF